MSNNYRKEINICTERSFVLFCDFPFTRMRDRRKLTQSSVWERIKVHSSHRQIYLSNSNLLLFYQKPGMFYEFALCHIFASIAIAHINLTVNGLMIKSCSLNGSFRQWIWEWISPSSTCVNWKTAACMYWHLYTFRFNRNTTTDPRLQTNRKVEYLARGLAHNNSVLATVTGSQVLARESKKPNERIIHEIVVSKLCRGQSIHFICIQPKAS